MPKALAETPEQVKAIADFYQNTKVLIAKESYKLAGGKQSTPDIVRDVLRVPKSSGLLPKYSSRASGGS